MTNWTPQQNNAIYASGTNLLVSAGAGSGKTAVLSERVVQKIAQGASVERFLIVTFTNAAAAEMRARISAKLADLSESNPGDRHLRAQTARINTAEICTIDAFCAGLVRENFETLGIERDFSVLDTPDAQVLQHEALANVLEPRYDVRSSAFTRLIELLSGAKNTQAFEKTVQELYSYIMVQADPLNWLQQMCVLYDPENESGPARWCEILQRDYEGGLQYACNMYASIRASLTPDDCMFDGYSALIEREEAFLKKLQAQLGSLATCRDLVQNFSMESMPRSPKGYTSPVKAALSAVRKFVKDNILNAPYLQIDLQQAREDMDYLYPCVCELYEIVRDYSAELLRLKKEQNAYEFSDIAQFALSLVADFSGETPRKTAFAQELSEKYDEILVDEYQDTNRAQDFLFTCISNGHNLFVVGDVKQSIYGFRLAMPEIFVDRLNSYFDYDPNEPVSSRIYLNKNFRSRDDICRYTNFLFSKIFSPQVGGLAYDRNEYLNAGAVYPPAENACISLRIVRDDASAAEDKTENEAQAVADFILEKISGGMTVSDKSSLAGVRPIEFGDFAVLFRKGKGTIEKFAKVFAENGIPVAAENAQPLFKTREVMLLLSLLRTVDNPTNDIAVLSVLMSGIFGFSADDIARLKVQGGAVRKNLYTLLLAQRDHEKVKRFLDFIDKYRNLAVAVSCSELIIQIMQDTLFIALMASAGEYENSRMNLMKFVDLAARYDYGDTRGLSSFLHYIDRILASDAVKSASGDGGSNAVRLMTVHKSKGLEFPFVILAGTASRYNQQDTVKRVLIHPSAGLGMQCLNEPLRCRYNTLAYDAVKKEMEKDAMSENVRVLYVALTRAKESFAAFMTLKDPEGSLEKFAGKISFADGRIDPYLCQSAGSDSALLLMTALFHPAGAALCAQPPHLSEIPDFQMDMKIVSAQPLPQQEATAGVSRPDPGMLAQFTERFAFQCDRSLSKIAAKRNASELDRVSGDLDFYFTEKPNFAQAPGKAGTLGGTAMHLFMQYCDYKAAAANLDGEVQRLHRENKLTQEEARLLDLEALRVFFSSSLASRILQSSCCRRECRLLSFQPVSAVENMDSDQKILVQGIADCIFEENGALVVVDFKTDRVKEASQLSAHYSRQMAFYKTAAEKQFGLPVKEVILYSFSLCCGCKIEV